MWRSPPTLVPFNEKPEMKAREITEAGKEALLSGKYDMVRVNYANPGAHGVCLPTHASSNLACDVERFSTSAFRSVKDLCDTCCSLGKGSLMSDLDLHTIKLCLPTNTLASLHRAILSAACKAWQISVAVLPVHRQRLTRLPSRWLPLLAISQHAIKHSRPVRADMVGHTGDLEAAVSACTLVDSLREGAAGHVRQDGRALAADGRPRQRGRHGAAPEEVQRAHDGRGRPTSSPSPPTPWCAFNASMVSLAAMSFWCMVSQPCSTEVLLATSLYSSACIRWRLSQSES